MGRAIASRGALLGEGGLQGGTSRAEGGPALGRPSGGRAHREAARAQQLLDTCLFMVRAYVETKNDAEARRQARECRHLVPRVEPSAFRHTPEVRELLAEVDQQMASEAPGQLEVQSMRPDRLCASTASTSDARPVVGIELPTGMYRVQVEVRGR